MAASKVRFLFGVNLFYSHCTIQVIVIFDSLLLILEAWSVSQQLLMWGTQSSEYNRVHYFVLVYLIIL